jgi:hypothetical protein
MYPTRRYVLRIPRFDEYDTFEKDAALLKVASKVSCLAVPRTITFSETKDNALGWPYTLQHRIHGQSLNDLWEDLNHQQRLSITRQIAHFVVNMTHATNLSPGLIDVEYVEKWGFEPGRPMPTLQPEFPSRGPGYDSERYANIQTPISAVCARMARWDKWHNDNRARLGRRPNHLFSGLQDMARDVNAKSGAFGPDKEVFYLHHGDFAPRNIMVEVVDNKNAVVTGVLDWDLANFAPAIVAFAPPSWLWVRNY